MQWWTQESELREKHMVKQAIKEVLFQLWKSKAAFIGLIVILVFYLCALFAPFVATHDPIEQNIEQRKLPPFSDGHILGTDELGRDLFSRIVYGARISMLIGAVSVGIALIIGTTVGLVAGYVGGIVDTVFMRIIDIMLSFPYVLLTIVIVSLLGPSLLNAMIAIGISHIPRYARVCRAAVLSEKESDYVMAERSLGAGSLSLMVTGILPNVFAPVLVQATLGFGDAILSAAALSFLGLGAQPPTPEWGLMIASSRDFVTNAWWIVTFPGIATLFAVIGFNVFGDGLRDILDVRLHD